MFGVDGQVRDVGFALLEREMGKGVVFNEGDVGVFEGEADGADACVEFEDVVGGVDPGFDFLEHLLEEGKMGLRKGARMEGDGGLVERLPEEGGAVVVVPGVAEDPVVEVGVVVGVERMPEVVFEEALDEGVGEWVGVDEGELDFLGGGGDKELDVAESAGVVIAVGGDVLAEYLFLDESDGAVDGGVVDGAVGDGDDVMGVPLKEADLIGSNGEFSFEAGLAKALRDEGGFERVGAEKCEGVLPNGWIEVVGDFTAGAGGEMGTCGWIVHKLFTTCSKVVDKVGRC